MSWQDNDSSKYNSIDKVYVSQTEYWEVHHFIDHYLKTNNYELSQENKTAVKQAINQYPGRAPVKREDLTNYLNKKFAS